MHGAGLVAVCQELAISGQALTNGTMKKPQLWANQGLAARGGSPMRRAAMPGFTAVLASARRYWAALMLRNHPPLTRRKSCSVNAILDWFLRASYLRNKPPIAWPIAPNGPPTTWVRWTRPLPLRWSRLSCSLAFIVAALSSSNASRCAVSRKPVLG
jgi:hypothetical protein